MALLEWIGPTVPENYKSRVYINDVVKGASHDFISQISLFSTPSEIFTYLDTPPMYKLTYIPKQSCRHYIFSARKPNVCSMNYLFSRHKLIQKSVSINHLNLNFDTSLVHLTIFNGSIMYIYYFVFDFQKSYFFSF